MVSPVRIRVPPLVNYLQKRKKTPRYNNNPMVVDDSLTTVHRRGYSPSLPRCFLYGTVITTMRDNRRTPSVVSEPTSWRSAPLRWWRLKWEDALHPRITVQAKPQHAGEARAHGAMQNFLVHVVEGSDAANKRDHEPRLISHLPAPRADLVFGLGSRDDLDPSGALDKVAPARVPQYPDFGRRSTQELPIIHSEFIAV
jgi:hypothetical protein